MAALSLLGWPGGAGAATVQINVGAAAEGDAPETTIKRGHRFRVFAVDSAGNADPSPATLPFRVGG